MADKIDLMKGVKWYLDYHMGQLPKLYQRVYDHNNIALVELCDKINDAYPDAELTVGVQDTTPKVTSTVPKGGSLKQHATVLLTVFAVHGYECKKTEDVKEVWSSDATRTFMMEKGSHTFKLCVFVEEGAGCTIEQVKEPIPEDKIVRDRVVATRIVCGDETVKENSNEQPANKDSGIPF